MQSGKRTRLDTASYQLHQHQQTEGVSKKNSIFSPTRYSPGEGPLRDNVDISHTADGSRVQLRIIHGGTQFQNTSAAVRALILAMSCQLNDMESHRLKQVTRTGL
jgi:hypothetical protein